MSSEFRIILPSESNASEPAWLSQVLPGKGPRATRYLAVPDSDELRRIVKLPRRAPPHTPNPGFALAFTNLFSRFPEGDSRRFLLWYLQAFTLSELAENGGAVAVIAVGGGKTLISYLAPAMVRSERPLLLIPASLRSKTRKEFREYAQAFYGTPEHLYRIESYQRLATVQASELLTQYRPDLIVCDEAQHLRDPKCAAWRRIKRYADENPGTKFLFMTGTASKRSIRDAAHLYTVALKDRSPVPNSWTDLEPWAMALDDRGEGQRVVEPGALIQLATSPVEAHAIQVEGKPAALRAYLRRVEETPGVITSGRTLGFDTELAIRHVFPGPDGLDSEWSKFRDSWKLPDESPMIDPLEVSRHAREIALGFFYRWKVPGPPAWMEARREWGRFVRQTLKHSRHLDTELQVRNAIARGLLGTHQAEGKSILTVWDLVRPTFIPETEPVYLSDAALRAVSDWLAIGPGIVWVEQSYFGETLSKLTGLPYFGSEGRDSKGREILAYTPGAPCIASIQANGKGLNLQAWHRSLITSVPYTGIQMEQLLGRTHRPNQEAKTVFYDVLLNCFEHVRTFWRTVRDANFIANSTGVLQRLQVATIDVPETYELHEYGRRGPQWSAQNSDDDA